MAATVTVVPASLTAPGSVDLHLAGFVKNQKVTITIDGNTLVAGVRVGSKGTLDYVGVVVAAGASVGSHPVVVKKYSSTTVLATGSFTVTSAPVATVPGSPASLSVLAGDTVANASWSAPTDNGGSPVTGYRVYRNGALAASPASSPYTLTGLTNETTYSITVSAVNTVGEGPQTPPVSVTPTGTITPPPTYTFQDEFNGTSLNTAIWKPTYQVGDPGYGADSDFKGNLSQVTVANGYATIHAHKARNTGSHDWDSASMGTNGTFSQRYGTWEARIRYPKGQGVFPAFWMIAPGTPTTPPEFDIFEAFPSNGTGGSGYNYLSSGANCPGFDPPGYGAGSPLAPPLWFDPRGDLTLDWHVHRMVWTPSTIQLWIDDLDRGTYTDAARVASLPAMYPLLTFALGVAGVYRCDATTPVDLYMDIDYIRVSK